MISGRCPTQVCFLEMAARRSRLKLGEVLKKERERSGLSVKAVAEALAVADEDVLEMESGDSPYETWGPLLAELAITLEVPASRLVSESGLARDAEPGRIGGSGFTRASSPSTRCSDSCSPRTLLASHSKRC